MGYRTEHSTDYEVVSGGGGAPGARVLSDASGEPQPRILLAGAHSEMREQIPRALMARGYRVIAAENGKIALESARADPPSLILSDVMMPELDGFGLVRELRQDPLTRGIPIILLSELTGDEEKGEDQAASADDYLTEPFSARELTACVATQLKLARLRQDSEKSLRDLQERLRQALIAQKQSEAKTRATLNTITDGVYVIDADARLVFLNETSRRLAVQHGQNPDEMIGRNIFEVFPEVQYAEGEIPLKQALSERVPTETKCFFAQWRTWFRIRRYPTSDGGMFSFFQDITETHQAQARTEFLAQLTQKLSTVSDPAEINAIATSELGEFLHLKGCSFIEAIPGSQQVRMLPDWQADKSMVDAGVYSPGQFGQPELWKAYQRGVVAIDDVGAHPWTKEFRANYESNHIGAFVLAPFIREGRWVVCLAASSVQPRQWTVEEKQLLESVVARVWPLIERARAEEKLREANVLLVDKAAHLEALVQQRTAKLRETIGELEAFSYSIAHDLRAPLRSLQGFSELLLTEYGDQVKGDCQHLLHRISKAALRMDQLIRDVLNYSRVMREDFPSGKVDVEQLLRGIVDSYPALGPDKAEIILEGPFPTVLGNEAMLTQVFSNLMGNAVKFIPAETKPRIKIWAEPQGEQVRLFVQDNGIGIPADQHEKIFEMFQQVSKNFEGTGIGLAIVKKAVERMGGKVGLESELGQGSTFWIELQKA